jgi:hypothetical protein
MSSIAPSTNTSPSSFDAQPTSPIISDDPMMFSPRAPDSDFVPVLQSPHFTPARRSRHSIRFSKTENPFAEFLRRSDAVTFVAYHSAILFSSSHSKQPHEARFSPARRRTNRRRREGNPFAHALRLGVRFTHKTAPAEPTSRRDASFVESGEDWRSAFSASTTHTFAASARDAEVDVVEEGRRAVLKVGL